MKISYEWLSTFLSEKISEEALAELLTRVGLTVEGRTQLGCSDANVVVAQILDSQKHPNADRLSVCSVEDGSGQLRQIVCGAKNYRVGDKVPLALPGASLPCGMKIKAGNLRGVRSEGMLCSATELGLPGGGEGLLILPGDAPVGRPLRDYLPADVVMEVEVTPNRPDCLSHVGIAREISIFLDKKLVYQTPCQPRIARGTGAAVLEPGSGCVFYTVRRIRGVRVGASPMWLRRRLEAVGLRPINNVVDVTNYVLMELGQPLHAFDAGKVAGAIRVRQARAGEKLLALNGETYELLPEDTVIADEGGVLALGGVIGGEGSGVSEGTTEVLLESALFCSAMIRATSRRLGVMTDSSYRFERGVDPQGVLAASARATELILGLAGGEAEEVVVVEGEIPSAPSAIRLRHGRARSLLGMGIKDEEIQGYLGRICERVGGGFGETVWQPPTWRMDLREEVDLCEELCRLVGVERIGGRVVAESAGASRSDGLFDYGVEIRNRLVGFGFSEIKTSSLVSEAEAVLYEPGYRRVELVRLRNPLGEEHAYLRPSLLAGLLRVAQANAHAGAKGLAFFEIGTTYGGEPEELLTLGLVASGAMGERHWKVGEAGSYGFYEVRGVLEAIFDHRLRFLPQEEVRWPFVVAAGLELDGRRCGVVAILAPSFCKERDLVGEVVFAEVGLEWVAEGVLGRRRKFEPYGRFPLVQRDLAVVVEEGVKYSTIESTIWGVGETLLRRVEVFDVFRDASGQRLGAGKKSVAMRLTFGSVERTLKAEEVEESLGRIRRALAETLKATFRDPQSP